MFGRKAQRHEDLVRVNYYNIRLADGTIMSFLDPAIKAKHGVFSRGDHGSHIFAFREMSEDWQFPEAAHALRSLAPALSSTDDFAILIAENESFVFVNLTQVASISGPYTALVRSKDL